MSNQLILDLCKRVIRENGEVPSGTGWCNGISCYDDNCPFNGKGYTCDMLGAENIEIAKKYLKDNKINYEEFSAIPGWEIIKMLSNRELKDGTILRDEDGIDYTVFQDCLVDGVWDEFNSDNETRVSCVIESNFKIIGKRMSFSKAFNEYQNGDVDIQSCFSKRIFKAEDKDEACFTSGEITNSWYVNKR